MSNLDKRSIINMENTARYQKKSKLNVTFSTADRDSAVFVFNVTKDNKPLLLSTENVTGHIALKHNDGSFVKDTLHFTEPDINGRFEYYIPNDMLKREGTVTMQIFISEKGNSNVTVAERIVTFDIEKSIVSQISAETKLQYIVEYDELQAIIANRVTDIEDNMANAEDYVSQLKEAREKGLTDIEMAKTDNIKTLNDLADIRLEEMNSKASEYSSKFDADKVYMDDKHQAFKESVLNSEVVTQGESKEWQKYKLTEDNGNIGSSIDLDDKSEKIGELKTGFYHTIKTPIDKVNKEGFLIVISKNDDYTKVFYTPNNSNNMFIKTYEGKEESDWRSIPTLTLDEEIETKTDSQAKANIVENNAIDYFNKKIKENKKTLFEGNANGVDTKINLKDDYSNYDLLVIYCTLNSTDFVTLANPKTGYSIFIAPFNVTDSDGNGAQLHEARIEKTTNTQFTIKNDVYFDIKKNSGSGSNANKIVVNRITGWK